MIKCFKPTTSIITTSTATATTTPIARITTTTMF
jgi:hypothetical protein